MKFVHVMVKLLFTARIHQVKIQFFLLHLPIERDFIAKNHLVS